VFVIAEVKLVGTVRFKLFLIILKPTVLYLKVHNSILLSGFQRKGSEWEACNVLGN
jgi:hypothetical protein